MSDETTRAAIRLLLRRGALLTEWEVAVLSDDAIPSARLLPIFRLRDYVPRMIDTVVEALRGEGYGAMALQTRARSFARVHAIDRIDAGFLLEEVLRELAHLETVLVAELEHVAKAHATVLEAIEDARRVVERSFLVSGTRVREGAVVGSENAEVSSKRQVS